MSKTKILLFIDWFLPGTASGGPLRSYANLIERFNEGFEFYIITRNTDFGSTQPYKEVPANQWHNWNAYTRVYYCSQDKLSWAHLKRLIQDTPFDVAMVNGLYSFYFSMAPVWLLKSVKKPVLVSARGMLNPQAFSVKRYRKQLFLTLAKALHFYKGVTFHATNQRESDHIKARLGPETPVKIAPNLPRPIAARPSKPSKTAGAVKMVNIARIAKEKGTLVMLRALRQVQQSVLLDLYGPVYDTTYWQQCRLVIDQLPPHVEVTYKGVLPGDEVPVVLRDYHFMVLLSEGENFGHAIIESFAAGCPVIISDQTPWRHLEVQQIGWDVAIHDTPEVVRAFEAALGMTAEEYEIWSAKAYHFAKEISEDPAVLEANKALFLG